MVVRYTYNGTTNGNFTNGKTYILVGLDGGEAWFIDDNAKLADVPIVSTLNTATWSLASVVGGAQLYP